MWKISSLKKCIKYKGQNCFWSFLHSIFKTKISPHGITLKIEAPEEKLSFRGLSVVFSFLLVTFCLLLAVCYFWLLLVARYFLVIACYFLLGFFHSLFVTFWSLLVTFYSLLSHDSRLNFLLLKLPTHYLFSCYFFFLKSKLHSQDKYYNPKSNWKIFLISPENCLSPILSVAVFGSMKSVFKDKHAYIKWGLFSISIIWKWLSVKV